MTTTGQHGDVAHDANAGVTSPVAVLKAELFKALAHPLRVRVLEVLVAGPCAVGDLATTLGVELSHLSQQLGVLRRAGVVVTRRTGSSVVYSLRDPRMSQLLAVAKQMLATGLRDTQALLIDLEETGPAAGPDPTTR
jgi:DNA-binding transcriptional ArsR family regulator